MNHDGRNVPYFPLKLARVEGGWETYNPVENIPYFLNKYAKFLLDLCDGYNTLPEIVAALCTQYGLDPDICQDIVSTILKPLSESGMVWWRAQRVQVKQLAPPQSVFWELTWRCNLRCVHCVVSAGDHIKNDPTTRELKGIAWQLAHAGITSIAYSGGEPLIRSDFFEVAEHVAKLGMSAQLATNGLLVDKEIAVHLGKLKISAQVTINSSSPAKHDAFTRVPGSWVKSINAIRLLISAGVPTTVATIATKMSDSDIPAIVEMATTLGASSFRLIPFIPSGRGRQSRELELSPQAMYQITQFLRKVRDSGKINILPLEFEEILGSSSEFKGEPSSHIGCDGAVNYCTISPTGEVLPCSFFSGVMCDSLRDRPFRWIWANSRFLNYFRSLNINDLEGECAGCKHLAVCRGSCRATNQSIGALFSGNAHCWAACGEQD